MEQMILMTTEEKVEFLFSKLESMYDEEYTNLVMENISLMEDDEKVEYLFVQYAEALENKFNAIKEQSERLLNSLKHYLPQSESKNKKKITSLIVDTSELNKEIH